MLFQFFSSRVSLPLLVFLFFRNVWASDSVLSSRCVSELYPSRTVSVGLDWRSKWITCCQKTISTVRVSTLYANELIAFFRVRKSWNGFANVYKFVVKIFFRSRYIRLPHIVRLLLCFLDFVYEHFLSKNIFPMFLPILLIRSIDEDSLFQELALRIRSVIVVTNSATVSYFFVIKRYKNMQT